MKYVKQRMSVHSGDARYSAISDVARGLSRGRDKAESGADAERT
jgi:hypothetical protein